MTDKIREIKKAVLRLMLALAIGVLAGAAPGAVLISHAETENAAAAGRRFADTPLTQISGILFTINYTMQY